MSNSQAGRVLLAQACVNAVLCFSAVSTWAAERPRCSPDAFQNYPMRLYWGDTHLHTNLSVDAFAGTTLSPDDAYRFARGETVRGPDDVPMQLRRPLDFLVVADHAENLGLLPALEAGDPVLLATESGARWQKKLQEALPAISRYRKSREEYDAGSLEALGVPMHEGSEVLGGSTFLRSVWQSVARRADRYNDPGTFTAFSGYEWTPMALAIHRVVVFKDDAATVSQVLPFSQLDSTRPEDLWSHLESYTRKTGGEVLAIPHNPNLSRGHMFMLEDSYGKPFTREYARMRSRWEPLLEVTQIKGDSETHPQLSPNDEFANYERRTAFWGSGVGRGREYGYARSALKLGLDQQATLGVNPFKFGMIGSTDSHSALSAAESDDFRVVHPYPPGVVTAAYPFSSSTVQDREPYLFAKLSVGGYAAVWAHENTRSALFEAMQRREVYATTGPRIELRFFGGWHFEKSDALKPDLALIGYTKGVPMGGDLTHAPENSAPSFLIRAVKDPEGANLDRVQVIKGWRDEQGKLHEGIYNVALSDGRQKDDDDGHPHPVGSTVNIKEASYTNVIGDPEFVVVWQDPDFNPDELAFYYVRVIEIPTPRWTAYYAKHFEVDQMPSEIPMVTQERAYSSPIWYTP